MRATNAEELEAVAGVVAALGIGPVMPTVLARARHGIIRLVPLGVVARLWSGGALDRARAGLARELAVARHLAARNAPAIRPSREIDPGPHEHGRCVMTFWDFVPHRAAREGDARAAALALERFHEGLASFDRPLPPFTDAIHDCGRLIADPDQLPRLAAEDRRFLGALHPRLCAALAGFDFSAVPIHGDPHLGNALVGGEGIVWGDLEAVCSGPREWDIACLPASTWTAFAGSDPDLTRCLADLRSLCVANWCWADYGRDAKLDEAAHHHLSLLRERLRQPLTAVPYR